jgi:ribosome maturation protein Sdo1
MEIKEGTCRETKEKKRKEKKERKGRSIGRVFLGRAITPGQKYRHPT